MVSSVSRTGTECAVARAPAATSATAAPADEGPPVMTSPASEVRRDRSHEVTGSHRSQVIGHRSRVTGHRSQVTGHRSQVTDHISQVTGHWSQVTGYWSHVTGHRSQVTGHRSHVTGHRSQVTGHRSQVTGHGSQVTGHISQVTGYRSQVTGHRVVVSWSQNTGQGTRKCGMSVTAQITMQANGNKTTNIQSELSMFISRTIHTHNTHGQMLII